MSKKLILFLMLALFGSTSLLRADVIEIGNPNASTSGYAPSYSLYCYSLSGQIYTATEMGESDCTINSISFYWTNGGNSTNARTYDLYMKNVEGVYASSSDWKRVTADDMVYSGTVQLPVSGSAAQWVTITLDTPFEYSSDGNLLVVVNDHTGSWWSTNNFGTFTGAEQYGCLYRYTDGSAYDPSVSQSCNSMNKKNAIQLDVTPAGGAVSLNPATLELGERANNAWMEPAYMTVKCTNPTGATVTTSFLTFASAFDVENLNETTLEYKEEAQIEMKPAAGYQGHVEAVFAASYSLNEKDMATAVVTGDFYTAPAEDVVENATTLNFSDGYAEVYPDMANMHSNYNLPTGNMKDVVYKFTTNKYMMFNVGFFDGNVALYKAEGGICHPMADNAILSGAAPTTAAKIEAGTYYVVLSSNDTDFGVGITCAEMPALTEAATLLTPENGALEVAIEPTLTWQFPEGAAEYRVLCNSVYTLPEATSVVVDWTPNLATSVTLPALNSATQYFWRVDVRDANQANVMQSEKWGFTTTIETPHSLEAEDATIFEGENVYLEWKGGVGGGFEGEWTVCDGTADNSYVPIYGFYTDAYLKCQMIYTEEMLAEMEGGEITALKFYMKTPASGAWGSTFQVYMAEYEGTTISSYIDAASATTVYTGTIDGTQSIMTIVLDTPYEYEGGNLLVGINNITTGSYKSCAFYGITSNGSSIQGYSYNSLSDVSTNQRNFLPKTTFVCGDAKEGNRSFLGFNVYQDNVQINTSLLTEKEYVVEGLTYNMEGYNFGITAVWTEGESDQCENLNVKVSGNGTINGHVYDQDGTTGLANATIVISGKDEFGDDQEFTATTNAAGYYTTALKAGNYKATAYADGFKEVAQSGVVITYAQTTTVDFTTHENYNPVGEVIAEEIDETMSKVSWALGSAGGGVGDEFSFGFEDGFEGWTNIDGDGDGEVWYHKTEQQANHCVLTIDSHTGEGHVCSESYCNCTGALTPNNFLVTPQQYRIGGSSVFSFWACAQDASYAAEHFGVAISTAGNTSASDFTTIQEWTLTAKSDFKGPRNVDGTRAGTWYQFTVDLSEYAGSSAWIAIRHFNVSDQFLMCVDDVEMYNADAKGGRSLQYYTVYRQQTLNENGPIAEPTAEVINAQCNDTAYVDFNWGNMETGVYQYGVNVTYAGNHNPRASEWVPTVVIDENFNEGLPADWTLATSNMYYWTNSTMTQGQYAYEGKSEFASGTWNTGAKAYLITPAVELVGGKADVSFAYIQKSWSGDQNNLSVLVGNSTTGPWTEVWNANNENVSSWTEMTVDLTGVEGSYIAFCNTNGYGYATGLDNVVVTTYEEVESPITDITWSNYLPKNMDITLGLAVSANSGDDIRGAVATFTNVGEPEIALVYEVELDSTGLYTFEGFRQGWYDVKVELAGYATYAAENVKIWGDQTYTAVLEESMAPVGDLAVSSTGYAHWSFPNNRGVEGYTVMCNNVAQGQTTDLGMQVNVANLVEGQQYQVKVAAIYTTGMSSWATANFTYRECSNFDDGIEEVNAFSDCMDVTFTWSEGGVTPPTPPTPGEGDEFEFDFESGLQGWTNIDADGDGNVWGSLQDALGAGYGHNSDGAVYSQSYINYVGALTPNNYLVSPEKYSICSTSEFSLYACGQDGNYCNEHFGVAISTNGNTSASDFTTIAEWTIAGKSAKGNAAVRGTRDQSSWTQYTADLSAYAGQEVYIAVRHFNVTDQYWLDCDDFVLTTGAKGSNNGTFAAAGVAKQGNTMLENNRDGNWYQYDNGNNEDAIGTGGGNFWWGVMFPAGTYEGNKVTKTAAYDYMAMSGNVNIYQGGTSSPQGASLGQANVTLTGSNTFVETEFAEPITIDPDQNLWIVYYNGSYATYPAAVCANTGDANGRWVSLDGSTWADLASYGLSYTFMVRAYIEAGSTPGGPTGPQMLENSWALYLDGEFVECVDLDIMEYTMTMEDTEEHTFTVKKVFSGYDMSCGNSVDFVAGGVSMPANLTATDGEEGVTLTWNGKADSYKVYAGTTATNLVEIGTTSDLTYEVEGFEYAAYGVRAITECGQSDMAVIEFTGVNEINANTSIYPNPTSGDLHIYAQSMTQITIINTLGQVVYNQSVKADEMTLNMSQFGAGMYIVSIVTENGTSTQRVNVIK